MVNNVNDCFPSLRLPRHYIPRNDNNDLRQFSFGFAQDKPFGFAQDKPFGFAQDKPFGFAQDRPFDAAQDRTLGTNQDKLLEFLLLNI
jgi:hypothetical protein